MGGKLGVAVCLCVAAALAGAAPHSADAHAALLDAEIVQAVKLHARYDTGAPMAHAQVVIHAPDSPDAPWGLGLTDATGSFEFIPDAQQGQWTVHVRQSGHGATARLVMDHDAPKLVAPSGTAGWLQRAVMIALVAWGAFGTAVFALRGRGRPNASA